MSLHVHGLLEKKNPGLRRQFSDLANRAGPVLDQTTALQRHFSLARHAASRGWHAAATQMQEQASDDLARLRQTLNESHRYATTPTPRLRPTLRDVYDDLQQLRQEFDSATFELDPEDEGGAKISVTTEPIRLDDIYLGEFEIVLRLERLDDHADSSAFRIVALDPNPAGGNESVTHPHVQDEGLCAGEAAVPIASALADGRFCDAFLAINAVLNTYNPSSPYVSLSNWSGTKCTDCGCFMDEDESCRCDGCDNEICGDCISNCDVCDRSRCRSCLEHDEVSGRYCCSHCHHHCATCKRIVDVDSWDEPSGLCPQCLAKRQEQEKAEQEEQASQPEPQPQPQESDDEEQQHQVQPTRQHAANHNHRQRRAGSRRRRRRRSGADQGRPAITEAAAVPGDNALLPEAAACG
jgi:hypothetical protein